MKLSAFDPVSNQVEITHLKRKFGLLYGAVAGLAFAVSSWGWDEYMLSAAHAYFPWIMFLVGSMICALLGGLSGWMTARFQNSLWGALFWIITSAGFAWLMVSLPLQINPALAALFDPQLGAFLNYAQNGAFILRLGASLIWILPFMLIVGVTQLPMSESAVFSTSSFTKVMPIFFAATLMGLSGAFTDSLINVRFREAIAALDTTIQFVVDNQDNESADPVLSRQLHARALWEVREQVLPSRRLFVGSYDEEFGEFHVLVKFGANWVDCLVLYNQPNACRLVTGE